MRVLLTIRQQYLWPFSDLKLLCFDTVLYLKCNKRLPSIYAPEAEITAQRFRIFGIPKLQIAMSAYFTKISYVIGHEGVTQPTNSVALLRERTIPTERPPLVGEVSANFC
jgi:hypothetical protein